MKHTVTIKDIAEKTGVSKSTVSRALSGDSYNINENLNETGNTERSGSPP